MTIFDHIDALRSMGCAVCVITAEDIQILTADDDDEFTLTEEQALDWMSLHYDDVEEAIMGDYWSESVRAVLDQYPPVKPVAVTLAIANAQPGEPGQEVIARFDTIHEAEDYLATSAAIDPDRLDAGDYGIDAPEEMLNA